MFDFALHHLKNQYDFSRPQFQSREQANYSPYAAIPYTESEQLALALGYEEVADDRAYNRRYFIKDGKKWIHNLDALRQKLNEEYGRFICDEELEAADPEGLGYDVEAYYSYNFRPVHSIQKRTDFQQLLQMVRV